MCHRKSGRSWGRRGRPGCDLDVGYFRSRSGVLYFPDISGGIRGFRPESLLWAPENLGDPVAAAGPPDLA